MSANMPDPLSIRDQKDRISLEDLSPLEAEALKLLRQHPRMLGIFTEVFGSGELKGDERRVEQSLICKGLLVETKGVPGFVQLTPEGARLQAEALANGGAS